MLLDPEPSQAFLETREISGPQPLLQTLLPALQGQEVGNDGAIARVNIMWPYISKPFLWYVDCLF